MAPALFRIERVLDAGGRTVSRGPRDRVESERLYARRFPAYEPEDEGSDGPYRFYRFVPRTMKVFDEGEFGAARFVVLTVTR